MKINLKEQKMHLVFDVSEAGQVSLLHCSNRPLETDIDEAVKKWFPAVEVHVSGKNPDVHHGSKHIGSSSVFTLKYRQHKQYRNDCGEKLEITLQDEELLVTAHYQFYDGISVARTWTSVQNIGTEDVGLEYVSSFSLTGLGKEYTGRSRNAMKLSVAHNSWCREVNWKTQTLEEMGMAYTDGFAFKRLEYSNTGSWSTKEYLPMGALRDEISENCLMWQIENNGSWQWEISDITKEPSYLYLKLSGPTDNENCWYKSLKPGEIFESVKAAVCVGDDFDDALEQMTRYRRKIVNTTAADTDLPVIFNDYMNCLWADPTTEKELPVIDKAAEAGAEYYCMDAGWYADGTWWETVGEWQPVSWRFPNGMREVFDYIRSKGMVPGIWLEIESIGINCPILSQFTDDCFFVRHGKRVIDHGRYQLDFRSEKVREFATGVIDRMVADYGVGYIKMDYNINCGSGTELSADSFGDGLLEHDRAYHQWMCEIMDKYPDLVIENCSSGGMRMDYVQLSKHPIQSVSDQPNYRYMIPIAASCASAVLPEQAAIWSYPLASDDKHAVAANMVNAMLVRVHLSGEITEWNEEQFALVKEGIQVYKELRGSIREAVPFYPLGVESYEKPWACAGYKTDREVYLAVWRTDADNCTLTIPFDKLPACKQGKAELVYPKMEGYAVSFDSAGLRVTLPETFSGAVIKIARK